MRTDNWALLLCVASLACGDVTSGSSSTDVALRFHATVGGASARCGVDYTSLGTSDAAAQLADARLFLSELELRASDGTWVPLELDRTIWQRHGVALLDFEDGTAACADSGTPATNAVVTGSVPSGEYDGVRFRVGIPFARNHLDSADAGPPFDSPGMFWTWQAGYLFVRVDWAIAGGATARWNVHVGSTGCASAAPTEAPRAACASPNVAVVEIAPFVPGTDEIEIDFAALVAGADLAANTAQTAPGCMSMPDEADDCRPVYTALGLGFENGECVDGCARQTVFARR